MSWKDIYRHLSDNGFDIYSLGQHKGICHDPYLVLRNNGTAREHSVEQPEYEILLYYPVDEYSGFEEYIESVKEAMNDLYPGVKLVDDAQPHYPDDEVKAYMTSLIYRNVRVSKVNRL